MPTGNVQIARPRTEQDLRCIGVHSYPVINGRSSVGITVGLQVLEQYEIPFSEYDERGVLLRTSASADRLYAGAPDGQLLRAAAARLAGAIAHDGTVERGDTAATRTTVPAVRPRYHLVARRVLSSSPRLRNEQTSIVVVITPMYQADAEQWRQSMETFGLSEREAQVASLLSAGHSAKQIGARLSITTHTVRRHTERVYAKLGVHDRVAASLILNRAAAECAELPRPVLTHSISDCDQLTARATELVVKTMTE